MDDTQPTLFNRLFKRVSNSLLPENTEQLTEILKECQQNGMIDGETLSRLENSIKFSQLNVRDAMITRAQMDVIKTTDSMERIIAYAVDTAHSRFPVIEEDKDHIIGILHAKDLLKYTLNPEQFKLEHILRPAVFVPESKSLTILLKEFQTQHNHMAIVVDEYGGISGLVTFEDLIEEIVGKIEDEFDEDDSADNIFPVSAERWRIKATTEIEAFNAYFGTAFSDEEVDTIGGLIIDELGHLPVRGEKVQLGDLMFNVARADNRRLHTLMVTKMKEESE
ncbi:HlyC/CorC family transporter [Kingella negevensis]|uniref:HlyC/CorC family transporter n=1 Tax=Kingella negevensis TaxID=1522312 RepID=UPI00254CDF1D|nr:transporter associated domain-containing protein [Kingella negevensis]MDK4680892.1 transporter associated domain-containing protein [Kingella negevensis]MDK4681385.1 transporter associated domain-containing protein [Kingella negevensis]MDK4691772.1 transporter associated domain-containing protein [Kingella negevensis]MDK4693075.1 transporter associated domain-containing protein [Kingella negevensis]MDK4699376.1 transporter associated domain-containing protein [Kingella negevensis]